MNNFANKIKDIRIKSKLSQDAFAKVLGYASGSAISKIEKGLQEMSLDKLSKLVNVFNVDPKVLFADDKKSKEIYPNLFIGAHALIKNDEGKILIIQRCESNRYKPLYWDVPGGKMQYGEEMFQAIKREVFEETGLEVVKVGKPLSLYINKTQLPIREDVQIIFDVTVKDTTQDIVLSPTEHQTYRWIKIEELKTIKEMEYLKYFRINYLTKNKTKLVLLDFDGTIIKEDSVEVASHLVKKYAQSKRINEQYHNNKINGEDALRKRLTLLENINKKDLVEYLDNNLSLNAGVKEFLDFCNDNNVITAVFSGSYLFVLEHYQKRLGFTKIYGTAMNSEIIKLDKTKLFLSKDKGIKAKKLIKSLNIKKENVYAVGNSIADIDLFKQASLSFLINKKGNIDVEAIGINDFLDIIKYIKL